MSNCVFQDKLSEGGYPSGLGFRPDRCVHVGPVAASCVACLSVCPRDALALTDDSVVLDVQSCDGCGLCAAACPRRVFQQPLEFGIGEVAGHIVHFAACERLIADTQPGQVPCLNAIGLDVLLSARESGIHAWIVAHDRCEACPRGKEPAWQTRVDNLNAALTARGKPGIVVKTLPEARWRALFKAGARDMTAPGRRSFLRRVLPPRDGNATSGSWLEGQGPYPWSIFLDAWRCVACHACIRTCPEQAIRLEEAPTPAYRLDHAACTGCGVCRDVCDRGAVRALSWRQPDVTRVPLRSGSCRSCGASYLSTSAGDARGLCHICAERPKQDRLSRICD